ncbi:unnamed protein product [Paramecium sonneborni]|uniref:Uncharacterized protein n=1 Tax=Paramecium sonneborni TaxID=65129 RepID=A0A8S1P479_9CILI|nr:unnamed protein product [Paramecium sonneborni]
MKERFKKKDNFNSKMILTQLFSLLCTYYSGMIIVCQFLDFAVGLQVNFIQDKFGTLEFIAMTLTLVQMY